MTGLRRVLMIAFHFPPLAGSSGIQRTLRFVQHLPKFGWQPLVLTPHPRAYERTAADLMQQLPEGTVVRQAFALDAARHLSFKGRYLSATALPDRWVSWRFDAVRVGMKMIREFEPQAIWSTFPITTAHLIGAELSRRSGLPWVADFRDPMAQDDYPRDRKTWNAYKRVEEITVAQARRCCFTTPSAVRDWQLRYPDYAQGSMLLENGYDEDSFARAQAQFEALPKAAASLGAPHLLLHSGIVYPLERDPRQFLVALRLLHDGGDIRPGSLRVRLRAAVHEEPIRRMAAELRVEPYIELAPAIDYVSALQEMLSVDGLLVLQGAYCNQQVPAKVYEYARSGRPILGLADPAGDTATVLGRLGVQRVAALESAPQIAELLRHHLRTGGQGLRADPQRVALTSRVSQTAALAECFGALAP